MYANKFELVIIVIVDKIKVKLFQLRGCVSLQAKWRPLEPQSLNRICRANKYKYFEPFVDPLALRVAHLEPIKL